MIKQAVNNFIHNRAEEILKKKIDEELPNRIDYYINKKINKHFKSFVQAILEPEERGNPLDTYSSHPNNRRMKTRYKELSQAIEMIVLRRFEQEVDHLKSRRENLNEIRNDIRRQAKRYIESEDFIDQLVQRIKNKQL